MVNWQNGVAVTVAGAPFLFRQTVPLTFRMVLGVALPKEADRKGYIAVRRSSKSKNYSNEGYYFLLIHNCSKPVLACPQMM